MRLRRVLVLGSCGVAAVLGFASVAWACGEVVNRASLGVSPSRGPANSTVRVAGSNWVPGEVVAVTLGGQSVGNATADSVGNFSVAVRIPSLPTGTHAISASGSSRSAAFPFEVSPPPATDTGTSSNTAGVQDAGRPSGRIPAADPAGDTTTATPSSAATSAGDPLGQPSADQSLIPDAPAAGAIGSLPPGATGRARTSATSARPVARATPRASVAAPAEQASAIDTDVAVSPGSAQGDLWSGFASGPGGATRARGLADLAGPAPSSGPSPLAVGAGLAVIAMLALVVGFASAEAGRRRVPAHADRSTER